MESVITAMTTEFSSIADSLVSMLTTIVPIALPLLGIGLAVTIGIAFYRKITGKTGR